MAGKIGRSGRKKGSRTLAQESMERNQSRVPALYGIIRDITNDFNVPDAVRSDANEYLINRSQGNPKATHDLQLGAAKDDYFDYIWQFDYIGKTYSEQANLIASLGKEIPESMVERNRIVKVLNVQADIDAKTIEAEFELPSGEVEKRRY